MLCDCYARAAHIAFILKQNTAHNTEHRAKRTEHTLTGNAKHQQQSSFRAWGGWGQPSLRSSSSWALHKKRGPGQSHSQSQKLPATKVNCPSAAAAAWPGALGLRERSATEVVAVAVAEAVVVVVVTQAQVLVFQSYAYEVACYTFR